MTNKFSSFKIKEKPKICAIDLDLEIVEALQAQGLHCFSGTLGSQVKVPNSNRCDAHQCLLNYYFPPNLHEYDIVLIDLQSQKPIEYIASEHTRSFAKGSEQTVLLSSYPEKIFDPRPLSSSILRKELENFFRKETLIIIFCSANEVSDYHPVTITRYGSREQNLVEHSLYDFIPFLQNTYNKIGQSVLVADSGEDWKIFLQKYSKNFVYEIVFEHPTKWLKDEQKWVKKDDFIPLLLNSDNEIIGFVNFLFDSSVVFAFPQLKDSKKNFLLELIDDLLPGLFPNLFPYSEQFSWLRSKEHFLPTKPLCTGSA